MYMTRKAMQQALEYLERHAIIDGIAARDALRAALAQPVQPTVLQSIRIPTDTMEQEFATHERRGYAKGFAAGKVSQPVQPEPWTPEDTAHRPGGLAQPEQEPVAVTGGGKTYQDLEFLPNAPQLENGTLLYTSPPQRQPLTHEQRLDLLTAFKEYKHKWHAESILIDMVEAAHGIGNKT
jgi:hypothetical protein